jgi:hypothetical protein
MAGRDQTEPEPQGVPAGLPAAILGAWGYFSILNFVGFHLLTVANGFAAELLALPRFLSKQANIG